MAWVYQYFHMVECTQNNQTEKLDMDYKVTGMGELGYSEEFRKLLYMELSVVAPMLLVAGMVPGAIGVDEWRVQTVLFSSWTLFALLGLRALLRMDVAHELDHGRPHSVELLERGGLVGLVDQLEGLVHELLWR
ncbi:hypothetical protein T484DRAFT_1981343, partial [Baffinella frigidus]